MEVLQKVIINIFHFSFSAFSKAFSFRIAKNVCTAKMEKKTYVSQSWQRFFLFAFDVKCIIATEMFFADKTKQLWSLSIFHLSVVELFTKEHPKGLSMAISRLMGGLVALLSFIPTDILDGYNDPWVHMRTVWCMSLFDCFCYPLQNGNILESHPHV